MKKYLFLFIATSLIAVALQAQTLIKVWETSADLKVPESALYDHGTGKIFVSNINGSPSEKDGNGFISLLSDSGKIENLHWIDGLNAPKGMAVFGGYLYVADLDQLVKIDIRRDTIMQRYPVNGAVFLNDVAVDGNGVVYVSDTRTGKLHYLKDEQINDLLPGKISNINGLFVYGSYLYIGSADITALNLHTLKQKVLFRATGGVDGLERLSNGNFIFSNWEGRVFITNGTRVIKLLDTTLEKINTADIDFAKELKLVLVPTFFDNKVVAYLLE